MKKFTFLALFIWMAAIIPASAQRQMKASDDFRVRQSAPAVTLDFPVEPLQSANVTVNSKVALEVILGGSRYDMQTNQSVQNRIHLFDDGTIAATWIKGEVDPGYADRGTGYNYFDGTSWMPPPTGRIEPIRTGWPSIQPWNGNGEIIVCHQAATSPMVMMTRPVKGTGSWTQTIINPPAGASGLGWPRMITSGPNHNYVHFIVVTTPTGNGGVVYQGLDAALLYYRSTDGGQTWDKEAVILPQLTAAEYDGFSGDDYAWGTAHGDTIYFAVGAPYTDTFIMKSNDNGNTWTKIPVLSNAYKKIPPGTTDLLPWKSADGALACEMDKSGIIHLAFGVGGGNIQGGEKYITGNYNGLVYWNTTMPMVKDSLDLDTLDADGQLLGYVFDGPNPGDTIVAAAFYRVSLTGFPQITVDDYNNIYVIWSHVTPGNPSPDPYNYRHLWGRAKFHDKADWTPMIDFNEGVLYMFQEYVYESMAKKLKNDNLLLIYQTSSQPGSNIVRNTIPVHDVTMEFREIPVSGFFPAKIENPAKKAFNSVGTPYPNPASDHFSIPLTLGNGAHVSLHIYNMVGQHVLNAGEGYRSPGKHQLTVSTSGLAPGVYFYSVMMDDQKVTRKIVVE